ncbi:Archaeophage PsiM2, terminase large subunit [uncultured Caudovirales phage]|uniref:Archaeophage PsiM2, terminase large subunit n=1 Tax=uncultured Caudovirales phage TaxID=2100421 RepID=A0A6J5SV45_9CAUD|nr:Archaeophage PsiM2, terminase large subunit [uncultured Caudovirales phage]CAB4218297.1 Archaeophage PsiM2, terminase large subunit [uncultured Caudovirales phage]
MPPPINLTDQDFIVIEREFCQRSLAEFAKRAWHVLEPASELKWGWSLDAICLHLEAVTDEKIKRLLINVPPGSMKSILTGVIWPAWEWGPRNRPDLRYIGTAHEETLAIRDSRRCRDLIKSDWYQNLWPIKLSADLDGKREFGNVNKGIRQARSFTSMTGARADRVILDDPLSADSANSEAKLEAARIAFTETLPTRVNNEKSAIVVIMQRLSEKDTSGVILEMGLPYTHLYIPMRFEPNRKCQTSIGWEDPRTIDGELMFPERFSEEQVKELEKTLGSYGVAGQLQQRPSPRGGGIINCEWFNYWSVLPELEFRIITVDTAQKTGQQNDFSVLQCWGRSTVGKAIKIDQIRGKWEAPELLVQARSFWIKHKNNMLPACQKSPLRAMYVEDKVSGTGLIQTLRRESIPVLPVQRNKDKISRGYDAAPFIECGNVLLPIDAPWLSDFLAEVAAFPSGAHDDQIDPMFDAIALVQKLPALKTNSFTPIPIANNWR